jgi:hypothetical protein
MPQPKAGNGPRVESSSHLWTHAIHDMFSMLQSSHSRVGGSRLKHDDRSKKMREGAGAMGDVELNMCVLCTGRGYSSFDQSICRVKQKKKPGNKAVSPLQAEGRDA